jgi:SAM-dependent methyltransferase
VSGVPVFGGTMAARAAPTGVTSVVVTATIATETQCCIPTVRSYARTPSTSIPCDVVDPAEYHRIARAERDHWWYRSTQRLVRGQLAPWLRPRTRALDIGAGPGGNAAWLAQSGPTVALDIEPLALQYVRAHHPELDAVRGSADALPIAPECIDVAVALTVLYAVADDARAVREIARVLRPGGVVLLLEPASARLRRSHDVHTHGLRRYDAARLETLALDAGLTVRRTSHAKSFLVPPAAALALAHRLRVALRRPAAHVAAAARSDLEPRALDTIAQRVFGACARLEDRWLERRDIPFGTSVFVVATKPE